MKQVDAPTQREKHLIGDEDDVMSVGVLPKRKKEIEETGEDLLNTTLGDLFILGDGTNR